MQNLKQVTHKGGYDDEASIRDNSRHYNKSICTAIVLRW